MHRTLIITGLATIVIGTAALAGPPAKSSGSKSPEPHIELKVDGKDLKYTYDLRGLFDSKLWAVLKKNKSNEILVEVSLLDSRRRTLVRQYHRLNLSFLTDGKIRLATGPKDRRVFKNSALMLKALRRIPGTPIAASDFSGTVGHLEIQAMVNPVKVYSFPNEERPVASGKVEPRTYFDRKVELKSLPLKPSK